MENISCGEYGLEEARWVIYHGVNNGCGKKEGWRIKGAKRVIFGEIYGGGEGNISRGE